MARLLLKDLLAGSTYNVQLRAVDGDSVSEWSRLHQLTVTSDNTAPDVPVWSGTGWVVDGDTFVASWVALNTSLEQNADLASYEVELSDGSTTVVVNNGFSTSYTLTFDGNRNKFGTPSATVTARVRSVDRVGNVSNWSTLKSATNPAPDPVSSITATGLYDSVDVAWTPGTLDGDAKEFVVAVSTTSASTGFSTFYEGQGASTTHTSTFYATDHWYRVWVRDKFGSLSTPVTSSAVRPKGTFSVDSPPPNNATSFDGTSGFDVETQQAYIDFVWSPSTTPNDVREYEIRWSQDGSNWKYESVPDTETGFRLPNLSAGASYRASIRAVGATGNASAWLDAATYPITAAADSVAPSQPSAPTVATDSRQIQVSVSGTKNAGGAMEADVKHYEVFASQSSGFITYDDTTMLGTIDNGPAIVGTFHIPSIDTDGQWYVKVRAVDFSGNVSPASPQATGTVELIDTAHIKDLAVSSAKINELEANKIVAGTGIINDLDIVSTLTIGDGTTPGVIQSKEYEDSAGSAGFSLTDSGLIIKTGEIEAAALKIQNGQNIVPPEYAAFNSENVALHYNDMIADVNFNVNSKFGDRHLATIWGAAPADPNLFVGVGNDDYNIEFEQGETYIVSVYLRVAGDVPTTINIHIKWSDGSSSPVLLTANPTTGSSVWTRYSFTVVAAQPRGILYFVSPTRDSGCGFDADGFQIEKKEGALDTPSAWRAPGTTVITGRMIQTETIIADNLATGSIISEKIAANAVSSNNIDAGAITADHLAAGAISIGSDNFTLNEENGLTIVQPDGSIIRLPADGSDTLIESNIVAKSLEVPNGAQIKGTSVLSGDIRLSSQIEDPTSPPTVLSSYETIEGEYTQSVRGLARNYTDDGWLYAEQPDSSNKATIRVTDEFGVTVLSRTVNKVKYSYGTACFPGVTDYFYCYKDTSNDHQILRFDPTDLSNIDFITRTEPLISDVSYDYYPTSIQALANGNILIGLETTSTGGKTGTTTSQGYRVEEIDMNGDWVSTVWKDANDWITSRIMAFYYGVVPGTSDTRIFVWQPNYEGRCYDVETFNDPGTRDTAKEFTMPFGYPIYGICPHDGNLWTQGGSCRIRRIENSVISGEYNWSYAWEDSEGTHTTGLSPSAPYTAVKGARNSITAAQAPQEQSAVANAADRIAIYVSDGTTTWKQATLGPEEHVYEAVDIDTSSPGIPTNNFNLVAIPGEVRSSLQDGLGPIAYFRGDGDARFGNFHSSTFETGASEVVKFYNNGTFDSTQYPSYAWCYIELVGGGGGGGGCGTTGTSEASAGSGGGGGGYTSGWVKISDMAASESVIVGAGGLGGTSGTNNGSNGNASSFGSFLTANGGSGGSSNTAASGNGIARTPAGNGGTLVSNTSYVAQRHEGSTGGVGVATGTVSGGLTLPGDGGAAGGIGGGSRSPGVNNQQPGGQSGMLYGGGGSGAGNRQNNTYHGGGDGAPGVVVVHIFM